MNRLAELTVFGLFGVLASSILQADDLVPVTCDGVLRDAVQSRNEKGRPTFPFVGPENGVWTVGGLTGVAVMIEAQNDQLAVGVHAYNGDTGEPIFFTGIAPLLPSGSYTAPLDVSHDGSCLTCAYQPAVVELGAGGQIHIDFISPTEAVVEFNVAGSDQRSQPLGGELRSMERLLFGYSSRHEARFAGTWVLLDDLSEAGGPVLVRPFRHQMGQRLEGCRLGALSDGQCSIAAPETSTIEYDFDSKEFVACIKSPGGFGFSVNEYRFGGAGAGKTAIGLGKTVIFSRAGNGHVEKGVTELPAMMVRLFEPGYYDGAGQPMPEPGAWVVDGLGGVALELDVQAGIAGLGTFSYDRFTGAPVFYTAALPFAQLDAVMLDKSTGGSCLNCGPGSVMVTQGAGGQANIELTDMDRGTVFFSDATMPPVSTEDIHPIQRLYLSGPLQRLLGKWVFAADSTAVTDISTGVVINFLQINGDELIGCRAANLLDQQCDDAFPASATATYHSEQGVIVDVDFAGQVSRYAFERVGTTVTSVGTVYDPNTPLDARISRGVRLLSQSAME